MKISRLMSTQHPDNVTIPFFAENGVMNGDDEVKEAFYTFSNLGVDEQLWDAEGKEVDTFVVKKLLSRHPEFFKKNILGKDKFITLRVPNPDVEKDEGKILLEALHSIPRNFDIGKKFYNEDIGPVFEVVIPMCSSEKNLIRIHEYYKQFIIKNQEKQIYENDISLREWLGQMNPHDIRVTPLFETKDAIINADKYVQKYVEFEKIKEFQRVWFARSDPALNYGSTSAVLLGKIGLQKLYEFQEKSSITIYPILGCGSAPFRGNFKPTNADKMLLGYPSIQTFTMQSAFKYDYNPRKVLNAVEKINETSRKAPSPIDVEFASNLINKMEVSHQESIKELAPIINEFNQFIPQRRKRKLHIDLFGYARKQGEISLPRAINFCATLYSLGLPPDLLGLSVLTPQEIDKIRDCYKTIDNDMADALQYFNKNNLTFFPLPVQKQIEKALQLFDFQINESHQIITTEIMTAFKKQNNSILQQKVLEAAHLRKFLG